MTATPTYTRASQIVRNGRRITAVCPRHTPNILLKPAKISIVQYTCHYCRTDIMDHNRRQLLADIS